MWASGFDYSYGANVKATRKDGDNKRAYDEDGNRIPVVKVDPEEDDAYDARLRKVSKSLKNVAPPGGFFVNGERTVFPLPVMNVVGLGDLVAPATEAVMKELIAKCQLAPYGHGEKTLVNTDVRNTWELSVGQFLLPNSAWSAFVKDEILPSIRVPLGIDDTVKMKAKLYKMLLYEAGGKFEKHQDSEKEDGMFGTLVIVLPGHFEGGELVVHDPSTAQDVSSSEAADTKACVWNPASMDPFAVKYAAFYGDCPHQVKPVTKGYRLCLTYNLVNVTESGSVPRFGGNHPLYATLKDALCEFFREKQAAQSKSRRLGADGTKEACGFDITKPETHRQCKFVYVLDHKYTKAGLSFRYLKNKDALVADCLARFCAESNSAFGLYLSKIKYEFEWRGGDLGEYDSEDEEGGESGDLEKQLKLLSPWVPHCSDTESIEVGTENSWESQTGEPKSEVAPVGMFDCKAFEFDGKNEQHYTGNEGALLEKWYESAALLAMPVSVAIKAQLPVDAEPVFERWVSLVDTDPSKALLGTRGFENAWLDKWSLTSETGVKVLEAAKKLHSLDVARCLVTSTNRMGYQPKLREVVAPFGTEAVAAMCKSICHTSVKTYEYHDTYRGVQCKLTLVTSLLGDVKDGNIIASVLDAVGVKAGQMAGCEADSYGRALLMATRVSVDRAKKLLDHNHVEHFVKTAVPAIQSLATSCDEEEWKTVEKIVSFAIDQLTASEPAIKKLAYKHANFQCSNCKFYGCLCSSLNDFLTGGADSKTFSAGSVQRLQKSGFEGMLRIEPAGGNSSSMLVTKTYESSLMLKSRSELEALREILAKRSA